MFPNIELVAWLVSTAQHNEDYRHLGLIKRTSPRQSSIWLRSLVATVTVGSQCFSIEKAGGCVLGPVYRIWRRDGGGETKALGEPFPADAVL